MITLLRIAWRNLGRNRRRTGLTAGAVVFATLLSLLSLAMAAGMHERWIADVIRMYPGDVAVSLNGYRESRTLDYGTVMDASWPAELDALPDADGWAPRLETWALAIPDRDDSVGRAVLLVGVAPERESRLSRLGSSIAAGRFFSGQAEPEVVLGATLARNLGVELGDRLILLSTDYYGSQAADRFRVIGTLEVGDSRFDANLALAQLDQLQRFLEFPGGVSHLAVFAPRTDLAEPLREELESIFPPADYEVVTWPELVPDIVQLALLDDIGAYLTLGILITVAGFGILNTILMSVLERVREFGVMRALGLPPRSIFSLVVIESLLISGLGVLLGLVLALPLILWLEGHPFEFAAAAEMSELFNIEPVVVFLLKGSHVVAIGAVILGVALLASLAPAVRASRGRPVDALREF